MSEQKFKKWWIALLSATIIVYIIGLFVTVMDVDAAQYASISRQMYFHHDFLQLHCRNLNYLDKPPLLFWLSVVSFHIFGIHTWSYKLPSVIFTLIGIYATYKFAVHLYNKQIARFATLILATCQAFFLFNTDVRTDTILTACIIVSTWRLYLFIENRKWINAFIGFTFIALGMLAKGPQGACVPALALIPQIIYKRNWKALLRWEWFAGAIYILLLLAPMIYGLYEQYGIKGPYFFFWAQSFGRLTGSNEWHNDAGYFFFFHTFLWAIMPWTVFAVISFFDKTFYLVKSKLSDTGSGEIITYFGFILPFIAFSFSHYKLPHYIFNLFPYAAIFTAASFDALTSRYKWLVIMQKILLLLAFIGFFYLMGYLVPITNPLLWAVTGLLMGITLYFLFNKNIPVSPALLFATAATALTINYAMNAHFYPTLLTYQSGSNVGKFTDEHHIPTDKIFDYNYLSYSQEFYDGGWNNLLNADSVSKWHAEGRSNYYVGRNELLQLLSKNSVPYTTLYQTPDFPVTGLTFQFLDPSTRSSALDTIYLVEVK